MQTQSSPAVKLEQQLAQYPLLDALRGRRSRRFGTGMKIPSGPFTYESKDPALPLSEDEEAAFGWGTCLPVTTWAQGIS